MKANKIYDQFNTDLKSNVSNLEDADKVLEFTKGFIAKNVKDVSKSLDAFYIYRSVVTYLLKKKKFLLSLELCENMDKIDLQKIKMIDSGERDFYCGVSLFETGEKKKGLERIIASNETSKGRCFGLLPYGNQYKKLIKA